VTGTMAGRIFMGDLLPGLIVLAIGGSVAPPLLLLTILFLGSQRPLPNASSLTLGSFTTCAVIGILGLILFGGAQSAVSAVGRVISATVGALLIVLGLRSLLDSPDPDASPPRWIESINSMSPPRAFGMALFPLQVKNLAIFVACLNLIIASSLSPQGSILALGLVLVIFAIPVLAIIGLYAAVPHRGSAMLGSLQTWMGNYNRQITLVLCLGFEAFFLVRGLWGALQWRLWRRQVRAVETSI
jgi:Sap, sulfolipid-1-addressing protein